MAAGKHWQNSCIPGTVYFIPVLRQFRGVAGHVPPRRHGDLQLAPGDTKARSKAKTPVPKNYNSTPAPQSKWCGFGQSLAGTGGTAAAQQNAIRIVAGRRGLDVESLPVFCHFQHAIEDLVAGIEAIGVV